jgi:hypothetical protein
MTTRHFVLVGRQLIGTEKVMEDGHTYRQAWPAEFVITLYKYGKLEIEQLPDGRWRHAQRNIYGRLIRVIETQWERVPDDDIC